jgi:hypothetical protein
MSASKNIKNSNSLSRSTVASWVLHALKVVLGYESIRQDILLHYHPNLHKENIEKLEKIGYNRKHINAHVKTFDAFIESGKTRELKVKKIENFLKKIVNMEGTIVFTASNIQQDEDDMETHYQTFIVDNAEKKVYMIDPANDRTVDKNDKKYKRSSKILVSGQGVYYAEVAHHVIKPFFEENTDYSVELVQLSHPAQISEDDVFCQSWSLFILNTLITNDEYRKSEVFYIPEEQINKYSMILKFYKRIFIDIPALGPVLKEEYIDIINNCDDCSRAELLKIDPVKFLRSMTKADMV